MRTFFVPEPGLIDSWKEWAALLVQELKKIGPLSSIVYGYKTYDPANLADGSGVSTTVAIKEVKLGDFVQVSFSLDLQGIELSGYVSANGIVTVLFQNESGAPVDLGSGTIRVRVERADK